MPSGGQISGPVPGLRLQPSTPGVVDAGHADISGTLMAGRVRTSIPTAAAPSSVLVGSTTGALVIPPQESVIVGEGIQLGAMTGNVIIGRSCVGGDNLTSSASNAVIIGPAAAYNGTDYGGAVGGVAIGANAQIGNSLNSPIAIGQSATSLCVNGIDTCAIAIGKSASVSKSGNIAMGTGATDNGRTNIIRIGSGVGLATSNDTVAIGDATHTKAFVGKFNLLTIASQFNYTGVNDANSAPGVNAGTVEYTAISAARTVTIPAANTVDAGKRITVVDASGACSAVNTITLARTGADTINGAASAVLNSAYGRITISSNGVGKWTVVA